jgi:carbon storage regulator
MKGISMLCLARKKNQKILIGDNIVITVVEVSPGKVVIGIDAPADIAVHRQEVWDAIKKEAEDGQ